MTLRIALVTTVLLSGQVAHAGLWPDWGPARGDLRLGIAQGKVAPRKRTIEIHFAIKNTGRQPVSVMERLSCSGHVDHALELTPEPAKPADHRSPVAVVKVAPARRSCRKNVPIFRTIKPGRLLTSVVTFRLPASVQPARYHVLGRIHLRLAGQKQRVKLRSAPLRVDLRRFVR
jgi:hypothetical protein